MGEVRYHWRLLRAGRLLLDGGSMFGLIPRVVWTREVTPDDNNRIELAHNCLLLETERRDPALGRPRRVLIEAGTGDKLDAKMAAIFGLDGRTAESAVAEAGIAPAEIDHAIVTHLHFDHAGGLTRRARAGERPDWVASAEHPASGDCPDVKRTFPNAEVIVQRTEWDAALANDSVMTRTYYRDHLLPLAEHVRVVASPPPFAPGRVPHRDEPPAGAVRDRTIEVLPGIGVFLAPGHTWGQQAVMFTGVGGERVVFTPDVLPSRWHAGAAYSLAYDVEPYTSMLTKRWLLDEAARGGWTLVLDHEPREPRCRVDPDGRGWFRLVDTPPPPLRDP